MEVQSRREPNFDRRLFFYFSRLYERELMPIYPIALFTYDRGRTPEPRMHQVRLGRFQVLRFAYRPIELWKLPSSSFVRRCDRFGPMPDEDLALLESLDRARLEELVVAAARADSYDVWQARLREVAKRK